MLNTKCKNFAKKRLFKFAPKCSLKVLFPEKNTFFLLKDSNQHLECEAPKLWSKYTHLIAE